MGEADVEASLGHFDHLRCTNTAPSSAQMPVVNSIAFFQSTTNSIDLALAYFQSNELFGDGIGGQFFLVVKLNDLFLRIFFFKITNILWRRI